MEVLILNEEGEEAEALIVVPALEDVSGERLWRGSFSRIDLGRALHFRVRVQRVEVGAPSNRHTRFRLVPSLPSIGEELWRRPVIKPRPRPPVVRPKPPVRKEVPNFRRPEIKPVVPKPVIGRWGSKFKSSFKFCPYRYYGKLSVFRKALCQRSWERWYKKQWEKGKVLERALKGHNLLAQAGFYTMSYAWDRQRGSNDVLLSGFDHLDLSELNLWTEMAAKLPPIDAPDPRLEEAMELLASIDPILLGNWIIALIEAASEERFSEVYDSLLSQGLDKVEQALLLVLNSQDPKEAKNTLLTFVEGIQLAQAPDEDLVALIVGLVGRIFNYLLPVYGPSGALEYANNFRSFWEGAFQEIADLFDEQLAEQFTFKLREIADEIMENYWAGALGYCATGCALIRGLTGLLEWMAIGADRNRVEVGIGDIHILDNVLQHGGSDDAFDRPWELVAITGGRTTPLGNFHFFDPAQDQHIFIVMRIKGQGRCGILGCGDIVVVAQGDHCSVCSDPSKIDIGSEAGERDGGEGFLIDWIWEAIEQVKKAIENRPTAPLDKGIVTVGFTNRSAEETDAALQAIKDEFGGSDIPILVWRIMSDGTVEYECVGNCSDFSPEELEKMACKEATGSANCNARPWGSSSPGEHAMPSESNGNDSEGGGTQVGIIPPPPDPPSYCQGQLCIQSIGR